MIQKFKGRKDANLRLPSDTTTKFIDALSKVIDDDVSIRSQYLKKYWLTKFADPDPGSAETRRNKAIDKWLRTELGNRNTNARLRSRAMQNFMFCEGVSYAHLISTCRMMVARVLPWMPSLDIAYGGFSGGASTSKRRAEGHPALKFRGKADATRDAWEVFQSINDRTAWASHINESWVEPRFTRGNELFTVPKNSEIDRCACKEPDINLFLQRMLGNQIRYCLRRVGVDLNDQTVNGRLAMQGSITGDLATLDLSSASDSVTTEAVKLLMPKEWFYYLSKARSVTTVVNRAEVELEMFSSMGNGFTFELESLLFFSIAKAVAYLTGTRGPISVYGDDIICPTSLSELLIRALRFFGFTVNVEKSFFEGDFRESCGAYWHAGENVKPFFLRGPITRLTDLIKILNKVTEWSAEGLGIVDPRYQVLIEEFKALVPAQYWGGQDVSSTLSLVTGDPPNKTLSPVARQEKMYCIGGYLNWLHSALTRTGLSEGVISRSHSVLLYGSRRNRQTRTFNPPLFL